MQNILFKYEMLPTTWFYVSLLMIVGIFFKFSRFYSIRNLDLIGLIAFTPGLLLIAYDLQRWGYIWLFSVGGLFLARLLLDPLLVRRPLLEPNLNASGLTFTGAAVLVFLMANVITNKDSPLADQSLAKSLEVYGAGFDSVFAFANLHVEEPSKVALPGDRTARDETLGETESVFPARTPATLTRIVAVLAHLALIAGMVLIGYRHFDNFQSGVAAASLFLLLPYTSQVTGRVDHVIPALVLVWAVQAYRRPAIAGLLIGLAGGLIFYPFFLLPLWCSFYWKRGVGRFLGGLAAALLLLLVYWALTAPSFALFGRQLADLGGARCFSAKDAVGFWEFFDPAYRVPVIAAFIVVSAGLALWPAQKNLGTLLGCSALLMLGTQFWHPFQGGVYMSWYLPLVVLTIFRPNLEDRVALTAVGGRWMPRRKGES